MRWALSPPAELRQLPRPFTSHGWICQQSADQQEADKCIPAEGVTPWHLWLMKKGKSSNMHMMCQGHAICLALRLSQSRQVQQMDLNNQNQRQMPPPQEPSAARRDMHNPTHIPIRSWSETCVRAKARGTFHSGSLKSKSIMQLDYITIGSLTILTMAETLTGMSIKCSRCG
eukprot:3267312-Amphidinium_carterae.8